MLAPLLLSLTVARAGGQGGAGTDYLKLTEGEWDGKTPWFTGSCKFSADYEERMISIGVINFYQTQGQRLMPGVLGFVVVYNVLKLC